MGSAPHLGVPDLHGFPHPFDPALESTYHLPKPEPGINPPFGYISIAPFPIYVFLAGPGFWYRLSGSPESQKSFIAVFQKQYAARLAAWFRKLGYHHVCKRNLPSACFNQSALLKPGACLLGYTAHGPADNTPRHRVFLFLCPPCQPAGFTPPPFRLPAHAAILPAPLSHHQPFPCLFIFHTIQYFYRKKSASTVPSDCLCDFQFMHAPAKLAVGFVNYSLVGCSPFTPSPSCLCAFLTHALRIHRLTEYKINSANMTP